jgi:hypothetical protein
MVRRPTLALALLSSHRDAADQEAPCRLELPASDHLAIVALAVDPSPSAPQYVVTSALDSVLSRHAIAGPSAGKLQARKTMAPSARAISVA